MGNWITKLQGLFDLFLQSNCPLCQRPTEKEFCYDCERRLQRCQIKHPQQFWRGDLPVFAWGVYGGALKQALRGLKYDNQPQIAEPLGYWLGQVWKKSHLLPQTKLIVVPIPLHQTKLKKRGFNQAELLAQSFCQGAGLRMQRDGLERLRETEAQFAKSAVEREKNLERAFGLGKGFRHLTSASSVLLLDDIYTTGATAKSAAKVLRQHGIRVNGMVAIAISNQMINPYN